MSVKLTIIQISGFYEKNKLEDKPSLTAKLSERQKILPTFLSSHFTKPSEAQFVPAGHVFVSVYAIKCDALVH